jgi:hypothetical protein
MRAGAEEDRGQGGGHLRQRHDDTEGLFRLIQSIPSPKAEPFKRWLARVGKEWIDTLFATDYLLYGN